MTAANRHFSFVEQQEKPKKEPVDLIVFKKRRFFGIWTGHLPFCTCNEIKEFDNIIVCTQDEVLIAILPKQEFAFALSHELIDEE